MQPGRYTELFFLDEATALAAGHRPCAECRRADYVGFMEGWLERHPGESRTDAVDVRLHAERLYPTGGRRVHESALASLPDGAFVLRDGEPYVVVGAALRLWTPAGYTTRVVRGSREAATVITPPSLVEHLRHVCSSALPLLHPSAF